MNPVDQFKKIKEEFKEGNVPLYFQFFLMIRNNILLGEIEPGTRVPTIEELNKIFNVSHSTIRKAMALLENEQLITKKRGLGTTIRENVNLLAIEKQILENTIPTYDRQIISCGYCDPPSRVKKIYKGQEKVFRDGKIFKIRELIVSKNQTLFKRVVDSFIQEQVINSIGEEIIKQNDVLQLITSHLTVEHVRIKEIIRPWICSPEIGKYLQINDGIPIFYRTWVITHPEFDILSITEIITNATCLVNETTREL